MKIIIPDEKVFSISQIFPLIGEVNGKNNVVDGYHLSLIHSICYSLKNLEDLVVYVD